MILEENVELYMEMFPSRKYRNTSKRFNDVLEASKYYSGYVVELGVRQSCDDAADKYLKLV